MNGEILDLVVEQIYHEIVYFSNDGISEIQSKLDKNGSIQYAKLQRLLTYFKVALTFEENQILANTCFTGGPKGERMIPFKRLIEHTITKANIKIDFKVSYTKLGTMAHSK